MDNDKNSNGLNDKSERREVDDISGVETTGHEWDGLKELNNPLPRWWLWVFYICIIWSLWYWVVYPAWPTISGHTKGTGGYTQFEELKESQKEIAARQSAYLEKFKEASFREILNNKELYAFAVTGGKASFKDNCATCHGTGAEGAKGYPNLNDDDWLWGGDLENIYQTISYGIRTENENTRMGSMPSFGKDGMLNNEEIDSVVDYVLTLSGGKKTSTYERGSTIFAEQCAMCHGDNAKGVKDFGAPNLSDGIWLYGSSREDIFKVIYGGSGGVMPAWEDRLDDDTIRQLTVYVHQLGGGE